MKRHRIAEQDVRAAVRSRGIDRIEDVDAVVLEPNGSLSVLKSVHPGASALLDVTADRTVLIMGNPRHHFRSSMGRTRTVEKAKATRSAGNYQYSREFAIALDGFRGSSY